MNANFSAKNAIGQILFRMVAIGIPYLLFTEYGNSILKEAGKIKSSEDLLIKIAVLVIGALAFCALFNPKLFIKPILGMAILAFTIYSVGQWHSVGSMAAFIKKAAVYTGALACAYCVLYDSINYASKVVARINRRFSPLSPPSWSDRNWKNTAEKGAALEDYVCELYKRIYGNAMTTGEMKLRGLMDKGPGDQGADVVVELPNGRRLIIQCKNYSSALGNDAVQEITTARAHYKADELAIIAPNGFTSKCVELARSNSEYYKVKIELIDSDGLSELIRKANRQAA
jgi:hypothetical protein